jgi:hypothetical protein
MTGLDLKDQLSKAKEAYGEHGSGKTHLISTCPKPIVVDSFDPGGSKTLRRMVQEGGIIVNFFEEDNPQQPSTYVKWAKSLQDRARAGYFTEVGTYAIDSFTMLGDYALNKHAKGSKPTQPQYQMQQIDLKNALALTRSLPCHFLATGHLIPKYDKEGEMQGFEFLAVGRQKTTIPLLFDEIYLMHCSGTGKALQRKLRIESTSMYATRTRIGGGILGATEEPNIREILKKCGMPWEDKEVS